MLQSRSADGCDTGLGETNQNYYEIVGVEVRKEVDQQRHHRFDNQILVLLLMLLLILDQ